MTGPFVVTLLLLIAVAPLSGQRYVDRFDVAVDTPDAKVPSSAIEGPSAARTIGEFTALGAVGGAMLGLVVRGVVCFVITPTSSDPWDDEEEPCPWTKWTWAPPLIGTGGGAALGLLAGLMYVVGENLAGDEPEPSREGETP